METGLGIASARMVVWEDLLERLEGWMWMVILPRANGFTMGWKRVGMNDGVRMSDVDD